MSRVFPGNGVTRGFRAAWTWRRAYWWRVAPGIPGGSALILLPLLFYLPLEMVPIFGEQFRGIAILIWLSALSLALSIRGGEGPRYEASVWPYQKGFSLGEMALEDWILDLGLMALLSMWWASTGVLSLSRGSSPSSGLWLPFFSLGFTTAGLTHSLTLCLSALGIRRPSELTILAAVLSLLAPVLAFGAPDQVLQLARFALPPFRAAVELHGALREKEVEGIIPSLLHLLIFSGLVLWIGLRRLSGWRPGG